MPGCTSGCGLVYLAYCNFIRLAVYAVVIFTVVWFFLSFLCNF